MLHMNDLKNHPQVVEKITGVYIKQVHKVVPAKNYYKCKYKSLENKKSPKNYFS